MNKKECLCTKCKHKFNTKLKINEYDICPKCNQKLLLKRTTNYSNKDYVMYLIPYKNDKYIVRNYEIFNYMDYKKEMCHIVTEYGRQTAPGYLNEGFIINNMRRNTSGYFYISNQEKTKYWKPESLSLYGKCFTDEGTIKHKYYNPKDILDNAPISPKYYLSDVYMETLRRHRARHELLGHGFGYEIRDLDGQAGAIVCGGMGRERNLIIDHREHSMIPVTHIKGVINTEDIRKMTPREWARLQGFPDDFNLIVADTHLYKQFGNSVTVNVIEAIANNIKKVVRKEVEA